MTANVLRYPQGYTFVDGNGQPLALGRLYYFASGTTSPQNTYADVLGVSTNSNPITLDASGRLSADVYLETGLAYKELLTDSTGATIGPWPNDNVAGGYQADWSATSGPSQILNKPALAAVATSGQYQDLAGVPATSLPFTGDSGDGGAAGLVPAPAAGAALANQFLSAGGGWVTPPSAAVSVNLTTSAATSSGAVLTFASVPSSIAAGMLATDTTHSSVIPSGTTVLSTTATTVTLSASVSGGGVSSGDVINFYGAASAVTNLTVSETSTTVSIASSSGSGATIPAATDSAAGVLDAARAGKIDGLATVATTGSYADLANKPVNFTGDSGAGGHAGLVPAPGAGDAASGKFLSAGGGWSVPAGGGTSSPMVGATSSTNGAGGSVPAPLAGQQNYAMHGDGTWRQVAWGELSGVPSNFTPAAHAATHVSAGSDPLSISASQVSGIPASLATQNIDNLGRLGIGTTDTGNNFSFKGPSALFASTGDMNVTVSKNSSTNTASFIFDDNYSARAQFGLCGSDDFSMKVSPDGSTWYTGLTISRSSGGVTLAAGSTATTPSAGDNSTKVATTAYLDRLIGANSGLATLDGGGHLSSSQIPSSLVGALDYQGTWNASTNTPALASGVGTKGYYYKVGTAGTTTIDGNSQWNVGDSIVFDGTAWDKIDGVTNEVVSVAGLYGVISAAGLKSALAIGAGDVSGLAAVATTGAYSSLSGLPTLGSFAALSALASSGLSDATTAGVAMFEAASAAAQTALLSAFTGDTGAGGVKGLVPQPPSGSAAALEYLGAAALSPARGTITGPQAAT